MSERIDLGHDHYREPDLPTGYSHVCPGCGTWVRTSEWDGWCHRCAAPQGYAGKCEEWAAQIGWVVLLSIDTASEESIVYAVRQAAHYALEVVGRERRAA